MTHLENIQEIAKKLQKASDLSTLRNRMNLISDTMLSINEHNKRLFANIPTEEISKIAFTNLGIKNLGILNIPNFNLPKFDFDHSSLLESLKLISKFGELIKNNPEYQFKFISDLEILYFESSAEFKASLTSDLTDEYIKEKEHLLNENLLPYLRELGIDSLWLGANQVLDSQTNPDKLRHCLISLRTILEYLIDEKLAPNEKMKNEKMFEKDFKKYHNGTKDIKSINIKRANKILYFTSKIEFGILKEFTKKEIQYVCECYSILCNVHKPDIGITENQVRSLKVKTGITIWLLAYMNKIIEG